MLSLILSIVAMAIALVALARIRQRAIHRMDALDRRRGSNPMPTMEKPPAPPNPPAITRMSGGHVRPGATWGGREGGELRVPAGPPEYSGWKLPPPPLTRREK